MDVRVIFTVDIDIDNIKHLDFCTKKGNNYKTKKENVNGICVMIQEN